MQSQPALPINGNHVDHPIVNPIRPTSPNGTANRLLNAFWRKPVEVIADTDGNNTLFRIPIQGGRSFTFKVNESNVWMGEAFIIPDVSGVESEQPDYENLDTCQVNVKDEDYVEVLDSDGELAGGFNLDGDDSNDTYASKFVQEISHVADVLKECHAA